MTKKNNMYNVSILSIGDELCIGQTVNTNATWISRKLLSTGAFIKSHSSIRDDKNEIVSEIERLSQDNNLIIVTGGLGPTHDDITKKVLTEYFDDELVLDDDVLEYVKELYQKRGREFKEENSYQAMLPRKAIVFPNRVGTAQGMLFETKSFSLLAMPGVPQEMKYIVENSLKEYVKNEIKRIGTRNQIYRTIRTAGVPESDLASRIGELSFLGEGSLAFLPSYRGVRLRIGLDGSDRNEINTDLDKIEKYISDRVGDYITSTGDEDLSTTIGNLLQAKNKTITVAESCTGGLLGAAITEVPGSSVYFIGGVVSYSNEIKQRELQVPKKVLQEFGAVSEQTACIMAKSVKEKYKSDYGLSITGVAGPSGGTEEKPVGTVWIGLSNETTTIAKRYVFVNDRKANRELSVGYALTMLLNDLKG